MTFQSTVLLIANVFLILSLCVIGIMLYRQKNNAEYPPFTGNCPDYWDTSGNICVANSKILADSLTELCASSVDFSIPSYSGTKGKCLKQKWAKQCNLTWDGITNVENIC